MNKKHFISGSIILIVVVATVIVGLHRVNTALPGVSTATASVTMPPKVIVPARVIPADVNQNMQAALAARQQKLAQLAKGK